MASAIPPLRFTSATERTTILRARHKARQPPPATAGCDQTWARIRYRRRWTIETTVVWLGNVRRLVIRYERTSTMFPAFPKVACPMITLRQFCNRFQVNNPRGPRRLFATASADGGHHGGEVPFEFRRQAAGPDGLVHLGP